MKNHKDQIIDYYSLANKLRTKLLDEIREFVKKNGKELEDRITLVIDANIDEFISMSPVLMVSDDDCEDYSWNHVESISVSTGEYETLLFESGLCAMNSDFILINDLIDIYEDFLYVEDDIRDGKLVIEDGMLTTKE